MKKPYWQSRDGRVALYQGDSRELLPELPGVDAIISDPPYGIGYAHSGGGRGMHSRRNLARIAGDERPFDPRWLFAPRIQFMLLWGADHFRDKLPAGGSLLAWDKHCGRGPNDCFVDVDFAWTSIRVKRNICRFLWKGIACVKRNEDGGRRLHPMQKPIGLMQWCFSLCPEKLLVCDPYAGVGSTLVAALELGRPCVGIEIDRRWCKLAAARLDARERRLGTHKRGVRRQA